MSSLRTNYKDDVFTGSRKYEMTENGDGTVSFTDQTTYSQVGDTYGAAQINEANTIINNLDDKAYLSDDSAESGLADNDYFPFYDTSATSGKRTTWSNIKNLIKAICAIKDHASNTATTYGAGTGSQFGHVKLSDSYLSSGGSASNSVGASSAAVSSAYTKINNQLKANNNEIFMDYKNGKYGINTSANRGADTFIPFKSKTLVGTIGPVSTLTATLDCRAVSNYQYLSNDDFTLEIVRFDLVTIMGSEGSGVPVSQSVTHSYNASSGILTVTGMWNTATAINWDDPGHPSGHGTVSLVINVYV